MEDLTSSHWESTNIFDDDSFASPYDHPVDPTDNPFSQMDTKKQIDTQSTVDSQKSPHDSIIHSDKPLSDHDHRGNLYVSNDNLNDTTSLGKRLSETHLSEVPLLDSSTVSNDNINNNSSHFNENENNNQENDKKDLFFSLTDDIRNNDTLIPNNPQFQPSRINKNDALFNDSNEQVIDGNVIDKLDNNELVNQSKSTNTPIKMYKAKRPRRHRRQSISNLDGLVESNNNENHANSYIDSGDDNNNDNNININSNSNSIKRRDSDPLSARLANTEPPKVTHSIIKHQSPAQLLIKSIDAPLFDISSRTSDILGYSHDVPDSLASITTINSKIGAYFKNLDINSANPSLSDESDDLNNLNLDKNKKPEIPLNKYDILVGDPVKVGDLTNAHIVYSVKTKTDSKNFIDNLNKNKNKNFQNNETIVSRRYRDFRWVYHQLQSNHPGMIIPPPPSKQAMGRFNENFVENRRSSLEKMLIKISLNSILQNDEDFIMFLQSEKFSQDSKERERATGSGASSATDDVSYSIDSNSSSSNSNNTNGNSSSKSSGFMGAFGLGGALEKAFSNQPKIVEPDEYFKDIKIYIETLDNNLKCFYKVLENVIQQKKELTSVTEEFSITLSILSDLEINKKTSELILEFSKIELRIKELLERNCLQDMLTLGSVLDEYVRLIGSIKQAFQQRVKILQLVGNVESEVNKKQLTLDKFYKSHRNQIDKINNLKNELSIVENKKASLKIKFEDISSTIKKEMERFEVEKIEDFRNSVEMYLESLVENQKQCIEMWETFYERYNLGKDESEQNNIRVSESK
ncbi:sorting nexin 1 [Ascoidea rubescens DSM 1968]|uniref:Vps5-domain-containing protein n=1 Tax=Ascoidea rubescens DSM 1968 TaxID=1344418 RepID=A0A1D2VCT4_9ASCO|nr:Vps5-domain-containing protein [Ascoidea rubescens DSM 1968]ODV59287.1 Vps5-domain-containing protein [Ascoidea rubescens DSM 1968]